MKAAPIDEFKLMPKAFAASAVDDIPELWKTNQPDAESGGERAVAMF